MYMFEHLLLVTINALHSLDKYPLAMTFKKLMKLEAVSGHTIYYSIE